MYGFSCCFASVTEKTIGFLSLYSYIWNFTMLKHVQSLFIWITYEEKRTLAMLKSLSNIYHLLSIYKYIIQKNYEGREYVSGVLFLVLFALFCIFFVYYLIFYISFLPHFSQLDCKTLVLNFAYFFVHFMHF